MVLTVEDDCHQRVVICLLDVDDAGLLVGCLLEDEAVAVAGFGVDDAELDVAGYRQARTAGALVGEGADRDRSDLGPRGIYGKDVPRPRFATLAVQHGPVDEGRNIGDEVRARTLLGLWPWVGAIEEHDRRRLVAGRQGVRPILEVAVGSQYHEVAGGADELAGRDVDGDGNGIGRRRFEPVGVHDRRR